MYVEASQLVLKNWTSSFVLDQTFLLLSVKEKLQVILSWKIKVTLERYSLAEKSSHCIR